MQDPNPEQAEYRAKEIQRVCESFGYGNVMATACILWQQKLGDHDGGGACSVGPCVASLVPCGCQDNFREKCDWCAGTGKVTKRVKEAKDAIAGKPKKDPTPEYEIQRYLVVSTGHISKMDSKGLDWEWSDDNIDLNHLHKLIVYKFEYGWILWIDTKLIFSDYKGYSPAFKHLIKLAKKNKCQYLKIDRDGPEYDGLTLFDW